jgi:hypothetical protein
MHVGPRFKIAYVPWWKPLPLVRRDEGGGFTRIGYVWRQTARIVNNVHEGWIAFADEQTPEKLMICPSCNKPTDRSEP